MAETAPPFDALLRGASRRDRLRPLLEALGFRLVPPDHGEAVLAGEREGARVLVIELEGEISNGIVERLARGAGGTAAGLTLLVLVERGFGRLAFVAPVLDGVVRRLVVDRRRPRRSDVEALEEMRAREGEGGVALALRQLRALDRARVTGRFFRDFRVQRDAVAAAWSGVPLTERGHREQLALLLLSRLLFLYFLQREGRLAGDDAFLPGLLARASSGAESFYRGVLRPLFFGALNTRPEHRDDAAKALGALPYLNGGLFERHALERAYPRLDLPDDAVAGAFDHLLERYRFTSREPTETDAAPGEPGIDPEMLGRVFEGLMAADRRGATGTFYTPAPVVDRLTREACAVYLASRAGASPTEAEALLAGARGTEMPPARRDAIAARVAGMRVLDPACGSGAFLVGALARIAALRRTLGEGNAREVRRDVVARALHGVDLQEDAALLCALRLWLALASREGAEEAEVPPLPNLDRRVRQGDALVDPLGLLTAGGPGDRGATADATVVRAVRRITPLAARYLEADPREKMRLQRELAQAERELAGAWIGRSMARASRTLRERRAAADARDLFGERMPDAARAAADANALEGALAQLEALRQTLETRGALPFFSFGVHFAEATLEGFDLVVSNPPWIRAHRWPAALRALVRGRYRVCSDAGWARGLALSGAPRASGAQVDLALLFLERSLELLAPGGALGMVLPAKSLRSLYGSAGRRLLLEECRVASIEDHSLDQRSVFQADAFAALVVAEKRRAADASLPPAGGDVGAAPSRPAVAPAVPITLFRRGVPPLRFSVPGNALPLFPGDLDSPWLLVPPEVRRALRRMQAAGPPLAEHPGLRIRRGVFTGCNDVLLVGEAHFKLGELAWIRAEGARTAATRGDPADARRYEALVEGAALAALVRGSGVRAWRYAAPEFVLWVHGDDGVATAAPPRAAAYLERHRQALEARSGWRAGMPPGALFRVGRATLRPKVAWHDLAENLNAVALPATVPAGGATQRPLVPLNTVYFVPTDEPVDALVLAAYLNSLPVRTFARAIAERAKDARFRFFGWVVGALPLPTGWRTRPEARELARISAEAHAAGALAGEAAAELDYRVARGYGLGEAELEALAGFDRWLRGKA